MVMLLCGFCVYFNKFYPHFHPACFTWDDKTPVDNDTKPP